VKDPGLFAFLRRLLRENMGTRVFYVLGNHEPYQTTLEEAVQKIRSFEEETRDDYGGRFSFLHRNRYNIDKTTTILGCTLWSAVSPEQANETQLLLTDFNEQRGMRSWLLESHLEEHKRDLAWLNEQVQKLQDEEPHRQVAVLTHHSPTLYPRATDPRHRRSSISTGFATDLSSELCWTSPAVKLWAFGHTHYNCAFHDEKTDKLVIANQRGYSGIKDSRQRAKKLEAVLAEAHSVRKPPSFSVHRGIVYSE
jgi:hypothetical protein